MEYITLNNGPKMPSLGFGTFGLPADGTAKRCVLAALRAGYRHIDTPPAISTSARSARPYARAA